MNMKLKKYFWNTQKHYELDKAMGLLRANEDITDLLDALDLDCARSGKIRDFKQNEQVRKELTRGTEGLAWGWLDASRSSDTAGHENWWKQGSVILSAVSCLASDYWHRYGSSICRSGSN